MFYALVSLLVEWVIDGIMKGNVQNEREIIKSPHKV